MRCVNCLTPLSDDDDDAVEVGPGQRICGDCITRGLNPRWTGPRDYDKSKKQTAAIERERAAGSHRLEVIRGVKTAWANDEHR